MTQYLLIVQKKAVKAQQGEMMTVRTLLGIQIMGEREKKKLLTKCSADEDFFKAFNIHES